MTRSEREQAIARYLNGEMGSAEEQDFFIQVALDKELRHDLKAHRIVESAIRKDRDAESSQHTALRARTAAILAASTPPAQQAAESVRTAADHVAGAGGVRSFFSSKWFAAAVAATAVTIAAFLIFPTADDTPATHPALAPIEKGIEKNAAEPTTPPAPSTSSPMSAAPESNGAEPRTAEPAEVSSTESIREIASPERRGSRSEGAETRASRQQSNRSSARESMGREESERIDRSEPELPTNRGRERTPRTKNDSINIGVTIEIPK